MEVLTGRHPRVQNRDAADREQGGEEHTFTEVAEFGGGVVPPLNSGVPTRPECLALAPTDFIASGAQTTHTFEAGETAKYQCCIHPWMRAESR